MQVHYPNGESVTCDKVVWNNENKWFELKSEDGSIIRYSEPGTFSEITE